MSSWGQSPWRCDECGATGSSNGAPDVCPNCGARESCMPLTSTERTAHEGYLGKGRRSSSGRTLWIPQCSCGWRHDGYYQKPAAQRAVDRHLAKHQAQEES